MENWIIEYKPITYIVSGFYPPDYTGELPTKNFVKVPQAVRDEVWAEVVQHPMCYDPVAGGFKQYTPQLTLDDLKVARLNELKDSFNTRVSGTVTINPGGYLMQFDTTDAIKMEGAIKLLEATGATEGYLTQADDTTVYNVPLDVMKAVLMEMMGAFAACHARKQELRTLINAAQSKEDLDTIEIAWPV